MSCCSYWFPAVATPWHAVQPPCQLAVALLVSRRGAKMSPWSSLGRTSNNGRALRRRCAQIRGALRTRLTQMRADDFESPLTTRRDCETMNDLGKRLPSRGRFNCNESGETQRECKSTPICVARVSGRICAHLRRSAVPSFVHRDALRIRLEMPLYRSAGLNKNGNARSASPSINKGSCFSIEHGPGGSCGPSVQIRLRAVLLLLRWFPAVALVPRGR